MTYQVWSVVFGEQPTAAKWNILGTNDASFNDGTGIANLEIGSGHTSLKNDYKFQVYLSANQAATAGTFGKVTLDTKTYDTGTNFDAATNHRFTAPVNGFYSFKGVISFQSQTNNACGAYLYKNGALISQGNVLYQNGVGVNSVVVDDLQLTASDYIELWFISSPNANTINGGLNGASPYTHFSGFLISQT